MYLPDTNVFSEKLKPNPNPKVIHNLLIFEQDLYLANIVWQEVLFGVYLMDEGKRKQRFWQFYHDYLLPFPMLVFDKKCAEVNAKIRAIYEKKGKKLPYADSQIASIALTHNLTLVTRNVSDFELIDDLKIVNWFD